jgi:DUF1365 family protein
MSPPLLHAGIVAHVRHSPFKHRFRYRMWMLSAELDELDRIPARLFGHNRRAAVALRDRDHGPRDGTPLRPWAEALLAREGLGAFAAQIRFMAIPRIAGIGFNPIAFYFCRDAAGQLGAVIHQVKNTFGGQTEYVLPVGNGAPIQQAAGKAMHVSPFFDMQGGYRFAFSRPDFGDPSGRFTLAIRYGAEDTPRLTASMQLDARPLTDTSLARLLLEMPLMPAKVIAAIHWQALRLWLRGAKFHPIPIAPTARETA